MSPSNQPNPNQPNPEQPKHGNESTTGPVDDATPEQKAAWEATLANAANTEDDRLEALLQLTQTYEPHLYPLLLTLLLDESESIEIRSAIALCFGKFGEFSLTPEVRQPYLDAMLTLKRHPDATLRNYVMMALGLMQDAQAIPALIVALEDDDNDVFYTAADALANFGEDALEPLITLLTTSPENDIRCVAAWKLGELGFPDAIEPLVKTIKADESPIDLKALSIWALGDIGFRRPEVVAVLEAAAASENPELSERAKLAMKKIARHSN